MEKHQKMKSKSALFVTFLLCTLSVLSQDIKSLKVEALKAYKASVSMNYDAIFETTYPKVFDIFPKESMKQMLEQMMENEQFSIKLIEVEPDFSFGELKKVENKTFCIVDHNNVMTMEFKTPMEDSEAMIDIFKKSMDAKSVTFDKEKNLFRIELRSTLIAVADELTNNNWKFLNKDKENKLFNMVFDEKTQTALGL